MELETDNCKGNSSSIPRLSPYSIRFLTVTLFLAVALVQSGCVGLTGADSSNQLSFSPAKVDFGEVLAGSKKSVQVTLTNTGDTAVTLPQATIIGVSYTMSGLTLPATVDPGGVLTFSANFAPTAPGSASGSLVISSDAAGVPPESLALSGTGLNASGPTITSQPVSQTVLVGQTANFAVTATGTDPLSYQWEKNGSLIIGATQANYSTPAVATSDSGAQFTVVVTDSVGTVTSDPATLTVTAALLAPSITMQPANQTVTAGQTATFSVTAAGTSPLSYQWRKNGAILSGATGASYTTPATTSADNGAQYSVIVLNSVGSVTSNAAMLTVNTPVTITSQPVSQTVTAGQTATFSVSATGSFSIAYQWRKNGVNISGATAATYTTPVTTTADNGAQFSAVVTSPAGSVTSNSATLTVTAASTAPSITTQPANRTVTAGQTATFSVTASGTSPLSYQWRKNGANIGGATASSYTTPATTTADNGAQFTVVVSNSVGNTTSSAATLTVNTPVTITSQPVSQTVTAGQTATFSVTATGTAPLSYQWRKNGTSISGATAASYTTPATTSADNGAQFTVVVTNSAGSVASSAATLTVNTASLLLSANPSSLAFGNVNVGSTKTVSATISNTGNSSVTIANVSQSGPGFSASGISSGLVLAAGQTATLSVTFAPSATGSVTGNVIISSNATNSPLNIGLTGSGVQVSHSATLSWNASTSSVSGYNTYRAAVSGGPYTKLNASLNISTSYTDSTVQSGQTYYYVVTAVDLSGVESSNSTEASATIPSP
jgi:hypothetical protein